jgi:hypothetical protein
MLDYVEDLTCISRFAIPITYGYSRAEDRTTTYPTHFANCYRFSEFYATATLNSIQWMASGVYLYIGTKHGLVTYPNRGTVEEYAVEIGVHFPSQVDIEAIIYAQRRLDVAVWAARPKYIIYHLLSCSAVTMSAMIESCYFVANVFHTQDKFWILGIIRLASYHFFLFRLHCE